MVDISSLHHYVISGNSKVITTGRLVEPSQHIPYSMNAFLPETTNDVIILKIGGQKQRSAVKNCIWQWRV